MKKLLAIGLAAAMAVTMAAPVYASEGEGIAKEDLKIGIIYIGDENEDTVRPIWQVSMRWWRLWDWMILRLSRKH